jgi:dihydroneopterin aldolase
MRIVLEITDEALHKLVQAQVGKAVSEYTEKVIESLVSDIVKTKLERFDKSSLPTLMVTAAEAMIRKELPSNDWTRQQQLRSYLADAAVRILKEAK